MRTIAIPKRYSILHTRLLPILSEALDSQLLNMILLMMGLYNGRSVHLTRIASRIPSPARKVSTVERIQRFLSNQAVAVKRWYEPVARHLIKCAAAGGQVHLVIDSSRVGFSAQLMMVGLAYGRRCLPIAWTWVAHKQGHSTTSLQLTLLRYVQTLLPVGIQVTLVGDSEFGRSLLLEELDHWGWQYALRQAGDNLIWPKGAANWQRFDSLPLLADQPTYLPHALLTAENAYPTHLVAYREGGQKRPWLLATNLPTAHAALLLYRRRMWIEQLFGDLKDNGFDLEATHLRATDRLDRLTFAVCLLYVWFIALSEQLSASGLSALVDRADRRDLSLFRLGFDFLDRCLSLNLDPPPRYLPSLDLVLGS